MNEEGQESEEGEGEGKEAEEEEDGEVEDLEVELEDEPPAPDQLNLAKLFAKSNEYNDVSPRQPADC